MILFVLAAFHKIVKRVTYMSLLSSSPVWRSSPSGSGSRKLFASTPCELYLDPKMVSSKLSTPQSFVAHRHSVFPARRTFHRQMLLKTYLHFEHVEPCFTCLFSQYLNTSSNGKRSTAFVPEVWPPCTPSSPALVERA